MSAVADAPEDFPETGSELRDPSGRRRAPRVLVVDDSEVIRQLIAGLRPMFSPEKDPEQDAD